MSDPLILALALADPALADRLAAVLADVPGVRLVADPALADAVIGPAPVPRGEQAAALTPRESEVLALLAEGASNKGIARRLGISVHTAKFHVRSVMDKMEASGRTDAVAQAARLRLIEL